MAYRISKSKNRNGYAYTIIADAYRGKKRTTVVVKVLGNDQEIFERTGRKDAHAYALEELDAIKKAQEEKHATILVPYRKQTRIPHKGGKPKDVAYLFLQKICAELGLFQVARKIAKDRKFEFPLPEILTRLVCARVLDPCSKRSSHAAIQDYLEPSNFELHHVYRSLEVLAQNAELIQAETYKASKKIIKRNAKILYFDCTNFFFFTDQPEGLKQFGPSKEKKGKPIVQFGLFMDADGIPLAYNIASGNTSEQVMLKPLEEKLLKDFALSQFVVCTDAGLSSMANRQFNNIENRAYITTKSVKRQKKKKGRKDPSKKEQEDPYSVLDPRGFRKLGSEKQYNIHDIDDKEHIDDIFYKEWWTKEKGLEERLILTYSPKYAIYQRDQREEAVLRALKACQQNRSIKSTNLNDYRKYIEQQGVDSQGELTEKSVMFLNHEKINKDSQYDGLYLVGTNLEGPISQIIQVNRRRWQIEECFRILKTDFKARPVYLQKDEAIAAHFLTCFLALCVVRILEKRSKYQLTMPKLLKTLRSMKFMEQKGFGYLPFFQRTKETDIIHDCFDFRLDHQIYTDSDVKALIRKSKRKELPKSKNSLRIIKPR